MKISLKIRKRACQLLEPVDVMTKLMPGDTTEEFFLAVDKLVEEFEELRSLAFPTYKKWIHAEFASLVLKSGVNVDDPSFIGPLMIRQRDLDGMATFKRCLSLLKKQAAKKERDEATERELLQEHKKTIYYAAMATNEHLRALWMPYEFSVLCGPDKLYFGDLTALALRIVDITAIQIKIAVMWHNLAK